MFQQLGEVTDAPTATETTTTATTTTAPVGTIDSTGTYDPATQMYTSESGVTFRIPNYAGILGNTSIKGGTGFDFGALSDPNQDVKPIPVISDELRTELNTTFLNPAGYEQWTPAEQELYREGITAMNQQIYDNVSAARTLYADASGPVYTGASGGGIVSGGGVPAPAGNTPAGGTPPPDRLRQVFTQLANAVAGRRAPSMAASVRAGQTEKKPVPGSDNTVTNVASTARALATPENIKGAAARIASAVIFSKIMGAL